MINGLETLYLSEAEFPQKWASQPETVLMIEVIFSSVY